MHELHPAECNKLSMFSRDIEFEHRFGCMMSIGQINSFLWFFPYDIHVYVCVCTPYSNTSERLMVDKSIICLHLEHEI